jgi:hypothetical protein
MEKNLKKFDAVEWIRQVRDKNYEELGHLSTHEFLRTLAERGEKSELAQKLREKAAKRKKQ